MNDAYIAVREAQASLQKTMERALAMRALVIERDSMPWDKVEQDSRFGCLIGHGIREIDAIIGQVAEACAALSGALK